MATAPATMLDPSSCRTAAVDGRATSETVRVHSSAGVIRGATDSIGMSATRSVAILTLVMPPKVNHMAPTSMAPPMAENTMVVGFAERRLPAP